MKDLYDVSFPELVQEVERTGQFTLTQRGWFATTKQARSTIQREAR